MHEDKLIGMYADDVPKLVRFYESLAYFVNRGDSA